MTACFVSGIKNFDVRFFWKALGKDSPPGTKPNGCLLRYD